MKHQFIFLFGLLLILIFGSFKNTSVSNDDLLIENQLLKDRITQFETIDISEVKAVVELNKMNVVYRGVANPMTISMPDAVKFDASAPGLKKIDEFGHYELSPGSGLKVDVLIKGNMRNGDTIEDIRTFRIKDIGKPIGTINRFGNGNDCPLELTKENLIDGKVGVRIEDFMFELDYELREFKIKKNKQAPIIINGNVFNKETNELVRKANRNDYIYIFDIRLNNPANVCLPSIAPIKIKIVD